MNIELVYLTRKINSAALQKSARIRVEPMATHLMEDC
jgi:hypothetical protein